MACVKVELSNQNRKAGATLFAMNKITQDMRFKQAVIEYSLKHGVTKAAIRYKTSRQNIYRWRKKYDGTLQSLADRSHRPHSHPNQHTEAEIKLVQDMRRRNPHAGLVVFWVKLRQRGYTRSISGLYRLLRRIHGNPIKLPNPKYTPKPYEQMTYPGQKCQIDVKFVPQSCLVGGSGGGEVLSVHLHRRVQPLPNSQGIQRAQHIFLHTVPEVCGETVPICHRMYPNR